MEEPVKPTGLLPNEVEALRLSASLDTTSFGSAFGVAANVVDRWETVGVPTGPTALAIRLVADSMGFTFPEQVADGDATCQLCGAPASETLHEMPVCAACFRDPVKSMEALGFEVTRTQNYVSGFRCLQVRLPADREMGFAGRFLSEGLGTMLTKFFKNEPQLGEKGWDDAVYVHWIEPDLESLKSAASRELVKALVAYGMVDVAPTSIEVQHAPNWGGFDEEIVLLCGLLANEQSS